MQGREGNSEVCVRVGGDGREATEFGYFTKGKEESSYCIGPDK
jgi:hypothetical protein